MDDKLITREDALNAIERIWDRCEEIEAHLPEGDPDKTGYKMITDYLTVWKYLFTQTEIVHCKDCKYSQGDVFDRGLFCKHGATWFDVEDDHHCSWAKRRTNIYG